MRSPRWMRLENTWAERDKIRKRDDGESDPKPTPAPPAPPPKAPPEPPKPKGQPSSTTTTLCSTISSSRTSSQRPDTPTSTSFTSMATLTSVKGTSTASFTAESVTTGSRSPTSSLSLSSSTITSLSSTSTPKLSISIPSSSSTTIPPIPTPTILEPANPPTTNLPASTASTFTSTPTAPMDTSPTSTIGAAISNPPIATPTPSTPGVVTFILIGVGIGASTAILCALILFLCRKRASDRRKNKIRRPSNSLNQSGGFPSTAQAQRDTVPIQTSTPPPSTDTGREGRNYRGVDTVAFVGRDVSQVQSMYQQPPEMGQRATKDGWGWTRSRVPDQRDTSIQPRTLGLDFHGSREQADFYAQGQAREQMPQGSATLPFDARLAPQDYDTREYRGVSKSNEMEGGYGVSVGSDEKRTVLDNENRSADAGGGQAWVPGHARNRAVGGSGGSGNEMRGIS